MSTILLTEKDNLFNGDLHFHKTWNVFCLDFLFILLYANIMQIWIVSYVLSCN